MKTFIIAEAGINHDGDLQRAKDLIEAAKESGASAVKFQTYQTDKRVTKDNPAYDILKKCELTYAQQVEMIDHADAVGIEFFSTPFDEDALDFLVNDRGLKRIKLASFDVTNLQFLKKVEKIYKDNRDLDNPNIKIILSTGMANEREIEDALYILRHARYSLSLLHCVSSYPLDEKHANLGAIQTLYKIAEEYNVGTDFEDAEDYGVVGYSDHTPGIEVPALSVFVIYHVFKYF